jgi:hypothetical protein
LKLRRNFTFIQPKIDSFKFLILNMVYLGRLNMAKLKKQQINNDEKMFSDDNKSDFFSNFHFYISKILFYQ